MEFTKYRDIFYLTKFDFRIWWANGQICVELLFH